jgi:hypothetical protein
LKTTPGQSLLSIIRSKVEAEDKNFTKKELVTAKNTVVPPPPPAPTEISNEELIRMVTERGLNKKALNPEEPAPENEEKKDKIK